MMRESRISAQRAVTRRGLLRGVCGVTGAALATTALGPATSAVAAPARSGGGVSGSLPTAPLDQALRKITEAGMPGVFAEVRDGGNTWRGASGVADLETGRATQPGFQHRVGSITKTFVATALLQLVGERRLDLDAPIGRYLPAYAVDGVTVRMLLNHTSGIGDYDTVIFATAEDLEKHRTTTFTPHELARIGLAEPPTNAPGEKYSYSNTNYILAGLILEKITRRPATHEINRRILRPLGLHRTYFPGTSPVITGPHSKGYIPWYEGEMRDFSEYDMSWAWTAGELVSTTADLDRFYRALLGGRLLRPAQLAAMRTTVPMNPEHPEVAGYGLGLYRLTLSGHDLWGHDGLVLGHSTISWHSPDGRRQVSLASNMTHYAAPGQPNPIDDATFDFLFTALGIPVAGAQTTARSTRPTPSLPLTPAPAAAALAGLATNGPGRRTGS